MLKLMSAIETNVWFFPPFFPFSWAITVSPSSVVRAVRCVVGVDI